MPANKVHKPARRFSDQHIYIPLIKVSQWQSLKPHVGSQAWKGLLRLRTSILYSSTRCTGTHSSSVKVMLQVDLKNAWVAATQDELSRSNGHLERDRGKYELLPGRHAQCGA